MTRTRGTTTARGYGYSVHQKLRQHWAPKVATGTVACWRCGNLIGRTQPWDLGHDDHDRTRYRGPEHARCNRSAAATLGNRARAARSRGPQRSGTSYTIPTVPPST